MKVFSPTVGFSMTKFKYNQCAGDEVNGEEARKDTLLPEKGRVDSFFFNKPPLDIVDKGMGKVLSCVACGGSLEK